MNNRDREYIAFEVLLAIGENFYAQKPPLTIEDIVDRLYCPRQPLEKVLLCFESAGILKRVEESSAYLPSVPLENLTVNEAYAAIRNCCSITTPLYFVKRENDIALSLLERIEQSVQTELNELTVKEIIERYSLNDSTQSSKQSITAM